MTPKEKAENLIKQYALLSWKGKEFELEYYKQCAFIVVDEMIRQLNYIDFDKQSEDYAFLTDWWNQVKEEINKF
jgi:hypothetical protein